MALRRHKLAASAQPGARDHVLPSATWWRSSLPCAPWLTSSEVPISIGAVAGHGGGSSSAVIGGAAVALRRESGVGGTSAPPPVGFPRGATAPRAGGSTGPKSTAGAPGNWYPPRTLAGGWRRLISGARAAARFAFARAST